MHLGVGIAFRPLHGWGDQKDVALHQWLSAVRRMLGSLDEALLGQVIRIESDNTSTVAYINEGGVALRR